MKYLLFALLSFAYSSSFAQSKKVLENEINDLRQSFDKLNTKVVILEEKLKFAEKEISILNRQIVDLKTNQNTDNAKKGLTENSAQLKNNDNPEEETKPKKEASKGQCQATTKKGTRCSRQATSGSYCWQHSK
jgi:phage shock protein A